MENRPGLGHVLTVEGADLMDGTPIYDIKPYLSFTDSHPEAKDGFAGEKLEKNLGGIKEMTEIPGVMFVVDPNKEKIAILEARKLGIPVIGLVDTNCNPEDVDYAIPGNDDAIRAVKLIMDVMANAVIEGRQGESMEQEVDEQEQMAEDAKPESIEEVVAAEAEENK